MAFVKNDDPNGPLMLVDFGHTVEPGEWVEVPDEAVAGLVGQSVWSLVDEHGKALKGEDTQPNLGVVGERVEAHLAGAALADEPGAINEPAEIPVEPLVVEVPEVEDKKSKKSKAEEAI